MGHRISLLIALVVALASACGDSRTRVAATLPEESVLTLEGDRIDVGRVARGRVAVVSLWATWCDGCQQEFAALNRLEASTAPGRDVVVIGVAVGEPRAKIAEFARKYGLRYVQLIDEDFRFADAVGPRRVPTTLVVDRAGRIVYRGDALDAEGLAALRHAL